MSLQLSDLLTLRNELEGVSRDANDWILQHCFYCKNCRACSLNSSIQKELKRNNFKTKNRHAKWWRLKFVNDLPVLSKKIMNNHNFFYYLLVMSIRFKTYK